MKRFLIRLCITGAAALAFAVGTAHAADAPQPDPAASAARDVAVAQDAKCTKCHDESEPRALLSIYQTRHGVKADARTPTCQSCHGESTDHLAGKPPGSTRRAAPDVIYKTRTSLFQASDATRQSDTCIACHQGGKRMHWEGSQHQTRDVPCAGCHKVHAAHDDVRDKRTQPDVCFACHKEQRAQVNRPSHHPIPEGKMGCSDCHNPHGTAGPKLMARDSVNDTCYACHMEKRGPFVHTHEPVAEDCSNCHNPHGTTAESMLKARPPFLCHQCHTPHGGNIPVLAGQIGPNALKPTATSSGKSNINITQGRSCLNCHTQVHGTNNPSPANPTPQFNQR